MIAPVLRCYSARFLAPKEDGRLQLAHVHLLVEMNPKAAPSVIANNFKTVTSRLLRKQFGEALNQLYRKPVLWSRSYFVASCGGAPLSVIKQYIEQQERPE